MSIEQIVADVVKAEITHVRAEMRQIVIALEQLGLRLPPQLVDVPTAAKTLGVSVSTVRRRVKDGSRRATRVGSLIKIDLTALHPTPDAAIVALATRARRG